jgi:hemerythrin-like domain-containing protein
VHFDDEESTFSGLPLIPERREKLLSDHSRLRSSIAALLSVDAAQIDLQLMRQIGSMLDEHIRWEEHVLFPEIETTLSDDEIQKLEEVTEKIEVSRNRSSKQCRPNSR